ncbi:hypothetical protein [Streptomyces sp. ISL-66]|nr:hypothetical protein [Streptomyces sp. ISL-66]
MCGPAIRRHACDIALPGNDFWRLDGRIVQFQHNAAAVGSS